MAVLLGIPNEALLRIFHYLPKSVKYPKPQADILSLSLTCRQLAPLAREVLFTAPILHPCKFDIFLTTLFKYPDLRSKIRSLTVESNEIHKGWVISDPERVCAQDWLTSDSERACAQDIGISSRCAGLLRSSDLNEEVKQECIQVLQQEFRWLGNLLSLVLILLPNLSSLYLGGAPFFDLTFLRPVSYQDPDYEDHIRIPPQLSTKITSLELLHHCEWGKGSLSTFFPELRHLVLSSDAVWGASPKT
ncbi:unnamed protein product [Alternaria alternata]